MSKKNLNKPEKKGRDYTHYSRNPIIKEIMIATKTVNLVEFAEKIGVAYSTIANWNNRKTITKPQQVIRAFPEVNPEFIMFGNYPVLKQGPTLPDQSSEIVHQIMLELDITSFEKFAKAADIPLSQVRNWIKTGTIPSTWYTYLRKKYPLIFASFEESNVNIVEEPTEDYKKEVVNHALLEVIAEQKRKIAELEAELKDTKK